MPDLAPGLLDFFERGRRAQAEIERILRKHGAEQLPGPATPNPAPAPEAGGGQAASEISPRRPSRAPEKRDD